MPDDLVFDQSHERQHRFSRLAERIHQVGLKCAVEGGSLDLVDPLAVSGFFVSNLDGGQSVTPERDGRAAD